MIDWKDRFRKFLEEEGYNELLNPFAIEKLIQYIEINELIPLKSMLTDQAAKELHDNFWKEVKEIQNQNENPTRR